MRNFPVLNAALIGTSIVLIQPHIAVAVSQQEVKKIAQQITVQIVDPENPRNSGSGVIIKQTGNTYTVITSYHVVSEGKKILDYNQVLKINPKDATAYTNRGVIRKQLGDKQGAVARLLLITTKPSKLIPKMLKPTVTGELSAVNWGISRGQSRIYRRLENCSNSRVIMPSMTRQ